MQHRTTNLTAQRNAFTLIEVLIATFILALGSLGLIVLFAGAASQQQRSAQLDQSVFISKNAEAMMARRFGAIQGPGLSNTASLAYVDPGVWTRLAARIPQQSNPAVGTLSIDPLTNGDVYFEVEEPNDAVLYERASGDWTSSDGWTSGNPTGPFVGRISSTGHARTVASSMRIRIIWGREAIFPATGFEEVGRQTWLQVNEGGVQAMPGWWPRGAVRNFDNNDDVVVFTPGGTLSQTLGSESYIALSFAVDGDPIFPGSNSDVPTEILALRVNGFIADPTLVVDEIRLLGGFKYLSTDVISLANRVIHVPDDDFAAPLPGRPAAAYALLYRTSTDGVSSQLAAFTYSISGGRAGASYEPDERPVPAIEGNLDAPIVRIKAKLFFDNTLSRYYIQTDPPDSMEDKWILEPGQVLLVAGDRFQAGADFAVRVLSQREDADGPRGYLDRVPRAAGVSVLPFHLTTSSVTIDVWGVQPVVDNVGNSGRAVRWRLKPQEVRIFQL